jgi:hypothetical protein
MKFNVLADASFGVALTVRTFGLTGQRWGSGKKF